MEGGDKHREIRMVVDASIGGRAVNQYPHTRIRGDMIPIAPSEEELGVIIDEGFLYSRVGRVESMDPRRGTLPVAPSDGIPVVV